MWKSSNMHMRDGQICMKSYLEVIYIINEGAFAWYVYVYPYLAKIGFEIYISRNKGFGDSEYEFSLCICVVSLCIYKV
jgi:hypothetical protein